MVSKLQCGLSTMPTFSLATILTDGHTPEVTTISFKIPVFGIAWCLLNIRIQSGYSFKMFSVLLCILEF